MGRIKGVGVDCLTLIAETFAECGLVEPQHIPFYAPQWNLHRSEESYLDGLLQFSEEVTRTPLPADVAMWKFGRAFSHAALVIAWPQVIHADVSRGCVIANGESEFFSFIGEGGSDKGKARPRKTLSFWRSA
jgi:cell wall-associated NlpC family hydrolase